jgi:hypothetical protein
MWLTFFLVVFAFAYLAIRAFFILSECLILSCCMEELERIKVCIMKQVEAKDFKLAELTYNQSLDRFRAQLKVADLTEDEIHAKVLEFEQWFKHKTLLFPYKTQNKLSVNHDT